MPIQNQELDKLKTTARSFFESKNNEYISKINTATANASNKTREIDKLLGLLPAHKNLIKNPVLNQRFNQILSTTSVSGMNAKPNYARFMYFVRRLNEMEHSEFVLEKNPDYCKTILRKMAQDYLLMKKHLEGEKSVICSQLQAEKDRAFAEYQAIYERNIKTLSNKAKAIASREASSIINQIVSSV